MKLSWFNTSMGTHKLYLAYEYVQYKAMQDTREKEYRDSRSNVNNNICFEVRIAALHPRLHTEGFPLYVHTGPSTKGPPLRNYNSTLGVHYSSIKHNHLYTRGICTKSKHNHLYTRGIMHKAKAQTWSPLHKRDRHKAKTNKRLQSWRSNDHK